MEGLTTLAENQKELRESLTKEMAEDMVDESTIRELCINHLLRHLRIQNQVAHVTSVPPAASTPAIPPSDGEESNEFSAPLFDQVYYFIDRMLIFWW